jgi:putative transposase
VAQHIGADKYERSSNRTGERNRYCDRNWDTRVGSIELRVPRVRDGGYYAALLEPRRRGERALVAVVQEAYVNCVSTRRVDDSGQGAWHDRHVQEPGRPLVPDARHGS